MSVLIQVVKETDAYRRIPEHLRETHPYSSLAFWTFYLDTHHTPKGESCIYCQMFDGQTFTGSQLRSVFPDHKFEGDDIYPDVHKTLWGIEGTCACLLIREPERPKTNLNFWSGIGSGWTEEPSEE